MYLRRPEPYVTHQRTNPRISGGREGREGSGGEPKGGEGGRVAAGSGLFTRIEREREGETLATHPSLTREDTQSQEGSG